MSAIVGKAQQKKYADAFVLLDVARTGELPVTVLKKALNTPKSEVTPHKQSLPTYTIKPASIHVRARIAKIRPT